MSDARGVPDGEVPTHVRHRSSTESGGQTRDLSYPPSPQALVVPVYDNHTHLEIADGDGTE